MLYVTYALDASGGGGDEVFPAALVSLLHYASAVTVLTSLHPTQHFIIHLSRWCDAIRFHQYSAHLIDLPDQNDFFPRSQLVKLREQQLFDIIIIVIISMQLKAQIL